MTRPTTRPTTRSLTPPLPPAVILDLDGTLADTSADLLAAANACFRGLGLGDLLTSADAGTALRGGRAMLALGLSRVEGFGTDEVERQYPLLLDSYREAICVETALYPGAEDALARLRARGYRTGICTNKPEALAVALLDALGVAPLFDAVVGADTFPVRKPDPLSLREAVARAGGALSRSCLVGDTETDRRTAAAAGVPCLLVTFGPAGPEMAALEPHGLLGHFDDLVEAVEALAL